MGRVRAVNENKSRLVTRRGYSTTASETQTEQNHTFLASGTILWQQKKTDQNTRKYSRI